MSPELSILLHACRLYLGVNSLAEWKKQVDDSHINWPKVLKMASWHQIRPILYEALLQYQPSTIPAEIFENLKSFCQHLAIENLSRVRQMQELAQIFEQENINFLLHKGIHYATFYKSIAHREFGDIDVLVEEDKMQKVGNVMNKLGYEVIGLHLNSPDAFRVGSDFHLQFTRNNTAQSPVEIHFNHSSSHKLMIELPMKDVFEEVRRIDILGKSMPVPPPEILVLLLTIHHAAKEQWGKLKYILDFIVAYQFTKNELRLHILEKKLKESNLGYFMQPGLIICRKQFSIELNFGFENQDFSKPMATILTTWERLKYGIPSGFTRSLLFALKVQPSRQTKLKILKNHLITLLKPSGKEGIYLPKPLHILYIFPKIFRFLTSPQFLQNIRVK